MWKQETGKLTGDINYWMKVIKEPKRTTLKIINEIKMQKIATVTLDNKIITIVSRRIYREQKIKQNNRIRQQRFRNNTKNNGQIRPKSRIEEDKSRIEYTTTRPGKPTTSDIPEPKEWKPPAPKDDKAKKLWEDAQSHLLVRVGQQSYDTWFALTSGYELKDGKLVVAVPSEFVANWLSDNYLENTIIPIIKIGLKFLVVEQ
jgi:hypothetical protein